MMNKKTISILLILLILCSCGLNKKTPYKSVERYFIGYQTLNKDAINNINKLVEKEKTLNYLQKEKYKEVLKNHYKNLKYKIKKVKIFSNNARVLSEIEVNNNIRVLEKAKSIKDNFISSKGKLSLEKYNDYMINMMKKEKSKIKYEIIFNLHIEDNDWVIDNLSLINQEKMLGIYNNI